MVMMSWLEENVCIQLCAMMGRVWLMVVGTVTLILGVEIGGEVRVRIHVIKQLVARRGRGEGI